MNNTNFFYIVLLSVFCLVVASSCQTELLETGFSSGSIRATVNAEDIETRSAGLNGMELTQTIVMDEDSLLLQEYVCDNLSLPFAAVADTRSAVNDISAVKSAAKFGIQCFLDNYDEIDCAADVTPVLSGDDQYIADGTMEYISSNWVFTNGSGTAVDYEWLNKIYHTFWSYYPQDDLEDSDFGSSSTGRHIMTIDDYVVASSSAAQEDLLVAYNNRYAADSNVEPPISIGFNHILSRIFFDFSSMTTAGYTVQEIDIIGAISTGDCVITGSSASTTSEVVDVTSIVWDPDETVTDTFTMSLSSTTSDNFFMIPQTLPSDTKIKITMTKDGKTITSETDLSTTWLPGKYYMYKLTYDPATYSFKFTTSSASEETTTFTDKNTSDSVIKYVKITSTKKEKGAANAEAWDWDIQSYKIGSGTEVPVAATATSFTAEDLVVTEDRANKQLIVESKKWDGIDKGGHKYWTNADGKSNTAWVPADWSETIATTDNPLDLSNHNFDTGAAKTRETANCYIVRHAGTYKIPLVYGNGVYTFSGGSLSTFRNHADQNITSPFIENNYRSSSSKCTAGSATVEWQDRQETGLSPVIPTSSVRLVGSSATTYTESNVRYIQFTVSPDDVRQTNAVIAVRDNTSSKNIMWSWHIWVTNDPDVTKGPVYVKNHSGDTYGFFPSTALGWIEPKSYEEREDVTIKLVQKSSGETITLIVEQTKPDKIASSGVMYQWGRKDPFPTTGTPPTSSSKVTLGGAIKAPNKFITGSQNWCSDNSGTPYLNLWAGKYCGYASTSGTSTASSLTSKTIYDPSPAGYKVPSISAYSGFSTTGQDPTTTAQYNVSGTFDKGWNFNTGTGSTIFFDASGWSNNGSVSGKGEDGNYHSALIYNSSNMITYLAFGSNYLNLTQTQYTTLGAAVRPVEE